MAASLKNCRQRIIAQQKTFGHHDVTPEERSRFLRILGHNHIDRHVYRSILAAYQTCMSLKKACRGTNYKWRTVMAMMAFDPSLPKGRGHQRRRQTRYDCYHREHRSAYMRRYVPRHKAHKSRYDKKRWKIVKRGAKKNND